MAILTIDDFDSPSVISVLEDEPIMAEKFYQKGDNFYISLLRKFNIDTDYIPLPADVSERVREVLVQRVDCIVATKYVEPMVNELNTDNPIDVWADRQELWCPMVDEMVVDLTIEDFYDPENLPPIDELEPENPLVTEWIRG